MNHVLYWIAFLQAIPTICTQFLIVAMWCFMVTWKFVNIGSGNGLVPSAWDLAYKFSPIKCTDMFSMCLQSGNIQAISLKIYWVFNIGPHCFNICVYQRCPQIFGAICRNMGICDVFRAMPTRGNISRFYLMAWLPVQQPWKIWVKLRDEDKY